MSSDRLWPAMGQNRATNSPHIRCTPKFTLLSHSLSVIRPRLISESKHRQPIGPGHTRVLQYWRILFVSYSNCCYSVPANKIMILTCFQDLRWTPLFILEKPTQWNENGEFISRAVRYFMTLQVRLIVSSMTGGWLTLNEVVFASKWDCRMETGGFSYRSKYSSSISTPTSKTGTPLLLSSKFDPRIPNNQMYTSCRIAPLVPGWSSLYMAAICLPGQEFVLDNAGLLTSSRNCFVSTLRF